MLIGMLTCPLSCLQEVITMPGAGHYAFLDQPQLFLEYLHRLSAPYLKAKEPQVPTLVASVSLISASCVGSRPEGQL